MNFKPNMNAKNKWSMDDKKETVMLRRRFMNARNKHDYKNNY